jgi:thymidylate synthase (FAD)
MGGNEVPRKKEEVKNLIRYLYRNKHTSPFEMAELKFHLKLPIFVMRQHVRHRSASLNEYSGRYSEMSNEFYIPDEARVKGQSTINKQLSDGQLSVSTVTLFLEGLKNIFKDSYAKYKFSLKNGVSRELARIQLPLSNYTELYWKIDLHNFFHYVSLRNDPTHAQNEIVLLSQIMYELVKKHFPLSCQAFEDYKFNSITFSSGEQKCLSLLLNKLLMDDNVSMSFIKDQFKLFLTDREINEFQNKIQKLKD